MVKKITFYDKDEAIAYQLQKRQEGYVTKIIHSEGKYEVIMAGEAPEWKNPTDWSNLK
jgi:hypothetical protein